MNKFSTYQDLIRYAYNETDLKDADRIQRSIDGDPIIQDEFNELIEVMNMLDEIKVEPPEKSIKNIMEFSKQV